MKKSYLYRFLVLLTAAGAMTLTSCSKDDDDAVNNIVSIEMETDKDLPVEIDGVSIDFKILNSDSVAMKTFKEHEDFFFVLSFTNKRSQEIDFPQNNDIFGDDLFRVYTSDSIYVGRPWDWKVIAIQQSAIQPKSSRTIWCSWLTYSRRDGKALQIPGYELFKMPTRVPLPKGSYYTYFEINIHDGKKVKCRKEFKII